ncbi:MAG: DF family (seleno)protein [Chthonomonadales bacterium]
MTTTRALDVEVLIFEGCPNAGPAEERVRKCLERLGVPYELRAIEVNTEEKAAAVGFLGSPSVRINGADLEGRKTEHGMLTCRVYDGSSGVPPEWLIEAAVLRALRPRGILFLCVANSARSQMAEGIARALAPDGVEVWSAGSKPTSVRPEAIAVLREIGVDISHHRSKAVSEIPADRVDAVITLCAEEECPVFLGKAVRVHWGLPDPAAVEGAPEARLAAFRATRDELLRRIRMIFLQEDETGA